MTLVYVNTKHTPLKMKGSVWIYVGISWINVTTHNKSILRDTKIQSTNMFNKKPTNKRIQNTNPPPVQKVRF